MQSEILMHECMYVDMIICTVHIMFVKLQILNMFQSLKFLQSL